MGEGSYTGKTEFVEAFSLKIEELGHPRIYGQILGWLLICSPPHQSYADLVKNLQISKASVSNTTRVMLEQGIIEKVRIKGERPIYFKVRRGALTSFMEKQIDLTLDLENITGKGLMLSHEKNQPDTSRLERVNRFYGFLAKELPDLIDKYKEKHGL